jgi:hypothetical protein
MIPSTSDQPHALFADNCPPAGCTKFLLFIPLIGQENIRHANRIACSLSAGPASPDKIEWF